MGLVDLVQKAEDSAWLDGDAMVRPAEILEVLNFPGLLLLDRRREG